MTSPGDAVSSLARTVAPYGSWHAPIGLEQVAAASVFLPLWDLRVDGEAVFVTEARPHEGGRSVVLQLAPQGRARVLTPPGFDVRTRVHEYGGGSCLVAGSTLYFTHVTDGRVYVQHGDTAPQALTPAGAWRHADFTHDRHRRRLICVREDHSAGSDSKRVVNTIVEVPTTPNGSGRVLWSGADFVSAPSVSPDGRYLAFVSWNHAHMPWDATALHVARIAADGGLSVVRILVPESAGEAVMQPSWTADGRLRFISDRSGWWNLYEADAESGVIRPLAPVEADIGKAPWLLGSRAYAELPNGAIVAVLTRNACDTLAVLERDASDAPTCWRELASPYVGIDHIEAWGDLVVFLGSTATTRIAVATLDPITGVCRELHRAPGVDIDPRYVSHAVPFICCGTDDQPVHAWFYPPTNPDFEGPSHARPPVLVRAHGGPTAHRDPRLGEFCQFWTSRGVAVLDVNYSGSTGYGTAYRKRLNGRWGDLDILDVVTAACACAERGLVDRQRMAVTGASAGGFVVMASLAFHPAVFAAGISICGVSDIATLVAGTHKFESRYFDTLVGPLPEAAERYAARSPLGAIDRIRVPLLMIQGADDRIVSPDQAEGIVRGLRANGAPVAYLLFDGEGHGFRGAYALRRAIGAQLAFLGRVFGFSLTDPTFDLDIDNWTGHARCHDANTA